MQRTLELLESTVSARTRWHFLVLTDEDGRSVGECSDSGDPQALTRLAGAVQPRLAGRDLVADRDELLARLRDQVTRTERATRLRRRHRAGRPRAAAARPRRARRAGEPLWKWLDGAAPDPIPVYANINRMPGGRIAGRASPRWPPRAVAAGFTAVKCGALRRPRPGPSRWPRSAWTGSARSARAVGDDVARAGRLPRAAPGRRGARAAARASRTSASPGSRTPSPSASVDDLAELRGGDRRSRWPAAS